ncbi:MAG: N-acetylmuramoyl-L-alanine amidase [Bacillota bacterium]
MGTGTPDPAGEAPIAPVPAPAGGDGPPPAPGSPETPPGPESPLRPPAQGRVRWVPAAPENVRPGERPAVSPIRYVILRLTRGSYDQEIARYQQPETGESAHYVIRWQDGEITQMVREQDIAIFPGQAHWVEQGIVIAHELPSGVGVSPDTALWAASATLVREICDRYGIPRDRQHVLAAGEVPGCPDPPLPPTWGWDRYLERLQRASGIIVDSTMADRFFAGGQWRASNWNALRYGSSYHLARPAPVRDAAWFRVPIPAPGRYRVYTWYPSARAYNPAVPVALFTAEGVQVIHLDQRTGGGRWVPLGVFSFPQGDYWAVAVSRWTDHPGFVVADAFRFVWEAGGEKEPG